MNAVESRIVRVLSVSTSQTGRVTRARSGRSRRTPPGRERRVLPAAAPPPPATPVAPAELLAMAGRLRPLLDELVHLTGAGHAWGVRVLRHNVEVALRRPETLATAANQLDFVEELAGAVWDDADPGFRAALPAGPDLAASQAREARRRTLVAFLDRVTGQLCGEVEGWQRLVTAAAVATSGGSPAGGTESPL
jgi:hypothetical protein